MAGLLPVGVVLAGTCLAPQPRERRSWFLIQQNHRYGCCVGWHSWGGLVSLGSVNQKALMAHVGVKPEVWGGCYPRMRTERGRKLQARTKLAVSALELCQSPETSQEWGILGV